MSGWAALVERARLQPGETVLVHGATGTAGRLAVQLAKYLGAGKVIATGRNESELQQLLALGADAVIPFNLGLLHPFGGKKFEQALSTQFTDGIDIVIDYLWGESAKTIIVAHREEAGRRKAHPLRAGRCSRTGGEHRPPCRGHCVPHLSS